MYVHLLCLCFLVFNGAMLPVRGPSFAVLIHFHHDLRGVEGRAGIGVQQELLVLGQILSWSLFGQPSTVE